jgi:hypothetical protein
LSWRDLDPNEPPKPESVEMMTWIDGRSRPTRKLIHEFGFVIVGEMIADGFDGSVGELLDILTTWRERRQEAWLQTNFITRRTLDSIVESAFYKRAA